MYTCRVSRRITGPHAARHVVNHYCGIDLVPAIHCKELAKILRLAASSCNVLNLTAVASPNCSDVLELKIRYECELLLPNVLTKMLTWTNAAAEETNLLDLLRQYEGATRQVRVLVDEVEKMNPSFSACYLGSPPRSDRYAIAQKISQLLNDDQGGALLRQAELSSASLSVLNMSYSYAEPPPGQRGSCSVNELTNTCRLMLAVIHHHRQAQLPDKKKRASVAYNAGNRCTTR